MTVLNDFYWSLVVPEVHESVNILTIVVLGKVKFDEGLCFQFLWKKNKLISQKFQKFANEGILGASHTDQSRAVKAGNGTYSMCCVHALCVGGHINFTFITDNHYILYGIDTEGLRGVFLLKASI